MEIIFKEETIQNLCKSKSIQFFKYSILFSAGEHIERVFNEAKCKDPAKRVIHLPSYPGRRYTPRATIVYECGDRTACCAHPSQTCVAKHKIPIVVTFEIVSIIFIF